MSADCISKTYIAIAYTFNELFFAIARFTQIHKNYKESDSGELSLLSNALMALGCFIRILTSVRENASLLFILGFVQGMHIRNVSKNCHKESPPQHSETTSTWL